MTPFNAPAADKRPVPLLVVAGPTGAGKSALALVLARAFSGVVVNADSRQVYADFPIITAQPDSEALAAVPHRLYGFLPSEETLSAGAYAALAAEEINAIFAEGKTPVLVGGTGLYIRTLLLGIAPIPPVPPDVSLFWREECKRLGAPALHALLAEHDPQTAARLHPNDSQRVTRGVEVFFGTGKPLSHWHTLPSAPSPYQAFSVCAAMNLADLEPRLVRRIDAMLAAGAMEEAEAARAQCDDPTAPGWSGIGCAELYEHITGKTGLAACKAAWAHNTRAYAKRQITWFKRDASMLRAAPGEESRVLAACEKFLQTLR